MCVYIYVLFFTNAHLASIFLIWSPYVSSQYAPSDHAFPLLVLGLRPVGQAQPGTVTDSAPRDLVALLTRFVWSGVQFWLT